MVMTKAEAQQGIVWRSGTSGNDRLLGTSGNDGYLLGDGLDTVVASGGIDVIMGGNGFDTVDYSALVTEKGGISADLNTGIVVKRCGAQYASPGELKGGAGLCLANISHVVALDVEASAFALGGLASTAAAAGTAVLVDRSVAGRLSFWVAAAEGGKVKAVQVLAEDSSDGVVLSLLQAKEGTGSDIGFDFNHGGTSIALATAVSPKGLRLASMTLKAWGGIDYLDSVEAIRGTVQSDVIVGDANDNAFEGGDGNDRLYGGAGQDTLWGGNGDDLLDGGAGNDFLIGGAGGDTYVFSRGGGADTVVETGGAGASDRIIFGPTIATRDIEFRRVGNDLTLRLAGTADTMTLRGWYLSKDNWIDLFFCESGGRLDSSEIGYLVNARRIAEELACSPGAPMGSVAAAANAVEAIGAAVWSEHPEAAGLLTGDSMRNVVKRSVDANFWKNVATAAWFNNLKQDAWNALDPAVFSQVSATTLLELNATHVGYINAATMDAILLNPEASRLWPEVDYAWLNAVQASAWSRLDGRVFAQFEAHAFSNLNPPIQFYLDAAHLQCPTKAMSDQVIQDPFYLRQWHFRFVGALGFQAVGKNSFGIERIWQDFTGKGVSVGIFDDGLDTRHWDLDANYDATREVDVGGVRNDPEKGKKVHGTMMAGIIAAEQNGFGGVGVAPEASITGINITNTILSSQEDCQFWRFDVANCSWGLKVNDPKSPYPIDTGVLQQTIKPFLKRGADEGRNALGSVIVQATENKGGSAGGDTMADSPYVVHVGALDADGAVMANSDRGPELLLTAPGGSMFDKTTGALGGTALTTTYYNGRYTALADGASVAAAQVSGVVALMLDATPSLGWRDVQDILAYSALGTGSLYGGPGEAERNQWVWNGAANWNGGGLHYSADYGFGLLNAFNAVRMAQVWDLFSGGAKVSANLQHFDSALVDLHATVDDSHPLSATLTVGAQGVVETALVTLAFDSPSYDDFGVWLTSADGTRVPVMETGYYTGSGKISYTFALEAFRGEHTAGDWGLEVRTRSGGQSVTFESASISLWGAKPANSQVLHYTDEVFMVASQDPADHPMTLEMSDGGTSDWFDMVCMTGNLNVDLATGVATYDGRPFLKAGANHGVENVVAGDSNDRLSGDAQANSLYGMDGNDVLDGRAGHDYLCGGPGDDVYLMNRGTGFDIVSDDGDSASDAVLLGAEISRYQLWLQRVPGVPDALDVLILGSDDKFRLYDAKEIERLQTSDHWSLEADKYLRLADAMSKYAVPETTSLETLASYSAIKNLIDASWSQLTM